MPQRIIPLGSASAPTDAALSRIGSAVLSRSALPDPSLRLIEDLYPEAVARARFRAIWTERDIASPEASVVGEHFKQELLDELISIVRVARDRRRELDDSP